MTTRIAATVVAVLGVLGVNTSTASATIVYSGVRYPIHFAAKVVYVEDHESNAWSVKTAVAAWDKGTDVSVRYGKCRAGAGCIRIYRGKFGMTGWTGQTYYNYNTASHLIVGSPTVLLNDSYRLSAGVRLQVASHEIGHGLGLTYHTTALNSCLYPNANPKASRYPSAWDKAVLNVLY